MLAYELVASGLACGEQSASCVLKIKLRKMKNIAIILSGCGVYDGSEIGEAMSLMLSVELSGFEYSLYAPNKAQLRVVNHLNGDVKTESRNALEEAARIARGNIKDLKDFDANKHDALVLPGGFGAALNLSNYALGGDLEIDADVKKAVLDMYKSSKPIGAMCIAPVILAGLIDGVKITLGKAADDANRVCKMGAEHKECAIDELCVDKEHKICTTACYMLEDASLAKVFRAAQSLVEKLAELE